MHSTKPILLYLFRILRVKYSRKILGRYKAYIRSYGFLNFVTKLMFVSEFERLSSRVH